MSIAYRAERPTPKQMIELYRACTLGARRPLGQPGAAQAMLDRANVVIGAWDGDLLVGLARAWTDEVHVTYLADLAVRDTHQKHGIGKRLIRLVKQAAPQALMVLIAAPQAHEYYGKVGFAQHRSCWVLRPEMPV
jgi:predicted N-acetyltransferase YhbS